MDIDRRRLLATVAGVGLTGFIGAHRRIPPAGECEGSVFLQCHPLTRSLLDRARQAGDRPDRIRVEHTVRELANAQGRVTRPVIKWTESPTDAFDHLRRHGLNALLRMGTASFWHEPLSPVAFDEDVLERSFALRCLAADILRVDDWDRALMAPKLSAKLRALTTSGTAGAIFEARAVAAQIGWLETSLPAAGVDALCNIEALLSSGFSERSMPIHPQLMVFEACEHGLIATWEMSDEVLCVLRPVGRVIT
jgi:hypothetical protein